MSPVEEPLRKACLAALGTVRDPELDEPVTDLGFVTELTVGGGEGCGGEGGGGDAGTGAGAGERVGDRAGGGIGSGAEGSGTGAGGASVTVRLRLPTYFCAPNFAYLMVADAYDALAAVPGVARVEVRLDDHFAAEEINAGVAAGRGFAATFPGLAEGELDELRRTFWEKAHLAAQDRVCHRLRAAGHTLADLALLQLRDAGEHPDVERLRRRRRDLGLPSGPEAPLLVDAGGRPLTAAELPGHLRFARTVRISIEGNAGLCRGLLATRYGRTRYGRNEGEGS